MQWNEIRNRLKKTGSAGDVQKQPLTTPTTKKSSDGDKKMEPTRKSLKATGIFILILIIIVLILALIMQSRKVADLGPAEDAGLTRQEARDAQSFLEQIPPQPLTEQEKNLINSFSDKPVEEPASAQSAPATKR
jgi:hypothetical protein